MVQEVPRVSEARVAGSRVFGLDLLTDPVAREVSREAATRAARQDNVGGLVMALLQTTPL